MEIVDRDIHVERRRIFWQRAYLQTLDELVKQSVDFVAPRKPEAIVGEASDIARLSAEEFDKWEAEHGQATHPAPAGSNASDPPGDDPDDNYLGR